MISIRKGTFETNSSSTHSFAIARDSSEWERLRDIFDAILYGDSKHDIEGVDDIYDEEGLLELLKLLNEAQTILIEGSNEYH